MITSPDGAVVVDWTGAGRGPLLPSLGFLLWAAGARGMACVSAVVSGYRPHVQLQPGELDRLAPAISVRPLVLSSWEFATGRERLPVLADRVREIGARAAQIAARARDAFGAPADTR